MPHADFDLDDFGAVRPINRGQGGARTGAGRKPNGYEKPPEVLDFDKAKARNEAAKAGINEIELKIKSGEYLSRTAFREASATLLAELAQGLRGLPDRLERKFNLQPEMLQLVSDEIDFALASVADGLEMCVEAAPE